MELVWVRVLPTDLQLLNCLTTDLVVLLLKKKKNRSRTCQVVVSLAERCTRDFLCPCAEYLTEQLVGGRKSYSSFRGYC